MSTRSAAADDPAAARRQRGRRADRRGCWCSALPLMILLMLDPASASGVRRHADRPGPGERARDPAEPAADLRRRRPAVRAGQRRLGVPGGAEQRRVDVRRPTTGPGPACCRDRTRPVRPGRCRSGSAGRRPTTGTRSSPRSRRTCPAARSHPASTTRPTPSTAPPSCSRSGGRPGTGRPRWSAWNNYPPEIAQVTQLVAQYTQTGQGQGGAAATTTSSTAPVPAGGFQGCVPVSGPMTPGAVAKVLPNGLAEIPQGAPPAVQEMIAAGNQIIQLPLQLGWRPLARLDARPARPERRPRATGERRPRLRLLLERSASCCGAQDSARACSAGRSRPPGRLRTPGFPAPASGSRSTPAPPAGKGTRSSRSPGSCSTPSTAHPPTPTGTGPRWQPASEVAYELHSGSFVTRHPQGL